MAARQKPKPKRRKPTLTWRKLDGTKAADDAIVLVEIDGDTFDVKRARLDVRKGKPVVVLEVELT